jgi:pimeloyl-ACP methyl ester carboxylesterase
MTSIHEPLKPHDDLYLKTREGDVHVMHGGTGEPLVYLHGIGDAGYWNSAHEALNRSFELYAPDHPGFGFTDVMDDLDHIDDIVYHTLDLLDRLNIRQKIHLVGHSFGGWLAAELAVHSPDRFASLVLAAPLGLRIPGNLPTDIFLMTAEQRARTLYYNQDLVDKPDPANTHVAYQNYKDLAGLARFGWVPFMSDPKLERRLYRVTARTLVLAAEHDAVLPRVHCERYATAIEGARLSVLPDTGHAIDQEAPEAFSTEVIEFLSGRSRS